MTLVEFGFRARNPDVLSCIANLSNDEVFTPPELANSMLDMVADAWAEERDGANIWADPEVTFLDPATKSGVFLREVTRRLTSGLKDKIPNLEARVDHILTRQVFGVAITDLTSLLARRSIYCSKAADGIHSVASSFETPAGNVWYERTDHSWLGGRLRLLTTDSKGNSVEASVDGRCSFCGASQRDLARGQASETHAYAFIHNSDIRSFIDKTFGAKMHFDVIIGNPPYQLNDGGGSGSSASPIYQKFVDQAKKLEPQMVAMVIPSRWFTGGKGLDEFRTSMLSDGRISHLKDYPISADVFPKNGPKGGVCVFLWNKDRMGTCEVKTHFQGETSATSRALLEPGADVFIRFNEGVSVLRKVAATDGPDRGSLSLSPDRRFRDLVSVRRPFGLDSTYRGRSKEASGDLRLLQKGGSGFIRRQDVASGLSLVDSWKVFVGFAAPGTGDKDTYPHRIISTPFLGEPGTVSTETYLCIGPFQSRLEAENALAYLACRFTRFLILLHKPSQNTTRNVYTFVPTQDWSQKWTDEALYARYGITEEEIAFIEKVVRPMEIAQ